MLKRLFFALAFITAASMIPMKNIAARQTGSVKETRYTIAIDAGHGGIDGGATGSAYNTVESDINLKIASELKRRFSGAGFSVVMTRTGEGGLYGVMSKGFKRRDMEARLRIVERSSADILISVHLNKYSDGTRRGAQVFFKEGDEKSEKLAACIQNGLNEAINTGRKYAPLTGDYYLLNETDIPAVICECGFLSNDEDERLLNTEEHRRLIAERIFLGAIDFFASV